jgi:uncharacterized protein
VPLTALQIGLGICASLSAGFVDSIVGGGGLIQLPAITLLLPSSTATDVILGTNKAASVSGTGIAAATYRKRLTLGASLLVPAVGAAMVSSFLGARLSTFVSKEVFRPLIVVALLAVLTITLRRPDLGTRAAAELPPVTRRNRLLLIASVIGFYDGLVGPGTGTFFTIALVLFVQFDFLLATAVAKVLNVGTNLAALSWFLPAGSIRWALAIPMALANLTGSFLGARLALRKGASFVRLFFLIVVSALTLKLCYDMIQSWR